MKSDVYITNLYWDNIYLNFELFLNCNCDLDFFIVNKNKNIKYNLDYYKISKNKIKISINITNMNNSKMLENGKWQLFYKNKNNINCCSIKIDIAKKLEDLSKVFKYGDGNYAYIVTFDTNDDLFLSIVSQYMKENKKPQKLEIYDSNGKKINYLLKFFEKKIIYYIYFFLIKIYKKNGKRILFMSQSKNKIAGNLKSINDELERKKLNKKFCLRYSFYNIYEKKSFFSDLIYMCKLINLIAKQDYIFLDDYAPIFSLLKIDKKTKLIQVWHAGVGFKAVGYSRFGKKGSPHPINSAHRKYDYVIVDSLDLIKVYKEVFGLEESKFLPYGLPRLDNYLDDNKVIDFKKNFYNRYPYLKNKKIILFAPTYRGKNQIDAYYDYDKIEMNSLYDFFNDDYVVLFKMHPFIKQKILIDEKFKDRFYDFSNYDDINELFYITDILITDYSSNIYEFSLMKRPMIFYAYDKDLYEIIRGVQHEIDGYKLGYLCNNFSDVIVSLKKCTFENNNCLNKISLSNNSCEQIIKKILLKK